MEFTQDEVRTGLSLDACAPVGSQTPGHQLTETHGGFQALRLNMKPRATLRAQPSSGSAGPRNASSESGTFNFTGAPDLALS
ncbi:hypothetical protein GCM10007884_08370 [Methylobacterium brachythecii]|uniref:Uncharacterized protein n=1 Tax=Methylobacterium brachythecii TaxID=1176177 RepID=A0ABQ6CXN4_9HYPH|nr:hypothetical protein GCM10007884_08370 [Methylobacterium brachythecii]